MSFLKKKAVHTLRVNIKSLANEAKVIRNEIKKCRDNNIKNALHLHKIWTVKAEARSTQLALAAIRGVPYSVVETNPKTRPDWCRIRKKVEHHTKHWMHSNQNLLHSLDGWIREAKQNFK